LRIGNEKDEKEYVDWVQREPAAPLSFRSIILLNYIYFYQIFSKPIFVIVA